MDGGEGLNFLEAIIRVVSLMFFSFSQVMAKDGVFFIMGGESIEGTMKKTY